MMLLMEPGEMYPSCIRYNEVSQDPHHMVGDTPILATLSLLDAKPKYDDNTAPLATLPSLSRTFLSSLIYDLIVCNDKPVFCPKNH